MSFHRPSIPTPSTPIILTFLLLSLTSSAIIQPIPSIQWSSIGSNDHIDPSQIIPSIQTGINMKPDQNNKKEESGISYIEMGKQIPNLYYTAKDHELIPQITQNTKILTSYSDQQIPSNPNITTDQKQQIIQFISTIVNPSVAIKYNLLDVIQLPSPINSPNKYIAIFTLNSHANPQYYSLILQQQLSTPKYSVSSSSYHKPIPSKPSPQELATILSSSHEQKIISNYQEIQITTLPKEIDWTVRNRLPEVRNMNLQKAQQYWPFFRLNFEGTTGNIRIELMWDEFRGSTFFSSIERKTKQGENQNTNYDKIESSNTSPFWFSPSPGLLGSSSTFFTDNPPSSSIPISPIPSTPSPSSFITRNRLSHCLISKNNSCLRCAYQFYLYNDSCKQIPSNCLQFNQETSYCLNCETGFVNVQGACVKNNDV